METSLLNRPAEIAAADDPQRMFLRCLLHDAFEWHNSSTAGCTVCVQIGTCPRHWAKHGQPSASYRILMARLESYEGLAPGIACPLDTADRATLTAALPFAIRFRIDRDAPEDRALSAAYRNLVEVLSE